MSQSRGPERGSPNTGACSRASSPHRQAAPARRCSRRSGRPGVAGASLEHEREPALGVVVAREVAVRRAARRCAARARDRSGSRARRCRALRRWRGWSGSGGGELDDDRRGPPRRRAPRRRARPVALAHLSGPDLLDREGAHPTRSHRPREPGGVEVITGADDPRRILGHSISARGRRRSLHESGGDHHIIGPCDSRAEPTGTAGFSALLRTRSASFPVRPAPAALLRLRILRGVRIRTAVRAGIRSVERFFGWIADGRVWRVPVLAAPRFFDFRRVRRVAERVAAEAVVDGFLASEHGRPPSSHRRHMCRPRSRCLRTRCR